VTEVAARYEVSRQSVHAWMVRYRQGGLGGLADRPKRPDTCPHQVSAEIEAAVCELRREHPRWGPVRLVHELAKAGISPVPSRMSAYRALVRHGLIQPGTRKRRQDSYLRWEREAAMALWQIDIMGGAFLADGTEAKVVTGIDDHSRYCVICQVVVRATGRAVCLAFAAALRAYGIPDEVLPDNGKQFTDRFGKGGEVLFDRICRDNGIIHRLTLPRHPATTGKIERFHGSLRRELLDDAVPFAGLAAAQAAVDAWRQEYNTTRPHQALSMASPAERFTSRKDSQEEQLLPLRLPAILSPLPSAEANQGRTERGFTHLAWPGARQGAASGDHGAGQAAPDHQGKFPGALPPGPSQDTGPALRGRGRLSRRAGGVRAGRPAQREHGSRRQAALARPPPRRAGHHLLGRHRRDPPDRGRAASQVGPLSSVHRRPGPPHRHRGAACRATAAAQS
jgi:transposase InsO family protein